MELRRHRIVAGLTIDHVAEALECSPSKVSRIETAQVPATTRDVRDMLELYGVLQDERDKLIQLARDAREKGWWHAYSDVRPSAYVGLEAAADEIRIYEEELVPGLLQTVDYARTVIHSLRPTLRPDQVDRWVQLREARQAMLKQEAGKTMWAVINEAVLRRPVGGLDVMRQQLQRLVHDSSLDAVTIQVLSFQVGEHPAMQGSFTILGFEDPAQRDVVYLETKTRELFVDSDEELLQYRAAFKQLRHSALDPTASAGFLVELAKEL
jgi:transcriptional regulator with XRE-family HTH domain